MISIEKNIPENQNSAEFTTENLSESSISELKVNKDKKSNTIILLSEMGSCFLLTFLLLILDGLYIKGHAFSYYITLDFATKTNTVSHLMIGFYVFLDVLVTILIFERWSCNANPSVSFYLFLTKKDKGKHTIQKILFQFIGATIAGALTMIIVKLTQPGHETSSFTGFSNNSVLGFGSLGTPTHFWTGSVSIVIIEALAAFGLCWSLLSTNIDKKLGLISVLVYLFIAASAAAPTGVLSFNSARAFGPIIFHDIYLTLIDHDKLSWYNSELASYPLFFLSPFLGVYIYYSFTKSFDKSIVKFWFKAIGKSHEL